MRSVKTQSILQDKESVTEFKEVTMSKIFLTILFTLILFQSKLVAQFEFSVSTDKGKYEYGDTIYISSKLTNISDSSVTIYFSNRNTCQANFQLDTFRTSTSTICSPTTQKVTFSPGRTRTYNWTIDPVRFGLPQFDGIHELISAISFRIGAYFDTPDQFMIDTTYFEAPRFLGGQLEVDFTSQNDTALISLKDSLNIEVLKRWDLLPTVNVITEIWQVYNYPLDSLFTVLQNDKRIRSIYFNRMILYDSITVTSVKEIYFPATDFYLSNAYPNPFNSMCRFYVEIPKTGMVNIVLYNSLGEKAATIFRGELIANRKYTFGIDAKYLPSGVYYYLVTSADYQKTKKVILLR